MLPKKHYEQRVHWKGGSAPAAPDYKAQAEATAAADLAAQQKMTVANRTDQYTPWGSSTWTQATNPDGTPNVEGKWTNTVTLDPASQEALDQEQRIAAGLGNTASSMLDRVDEATADPFTMEGAPAAGQGGFQAVQEVQDAIMSRTAPDLLRQRQRQEAQLVAQGVGGNTGSEAWDRMQLEQGRNENDASQQALLNAMTASNDIFNRDMGARNQWINEQTMLRDKPLNEMLALLRGQSVQTPTFNAVPLQGASQGTQYGQAAQQQYGAQMDQYNAKQAANDQKMQAGVAVAGTALAVF